MKTRNAMEAAVALVEVRHAASDYSVEVVELAAHLAAQPAIDKSGRMALIAAFGLSTWPLLAREDFMSGASLARPVHVALAADPIVNPAPLALGGSKDYSAEEVAAYRLRALADLANLAERVRLSVLTGGAAKAQTYREKLAEVDRIEAALAEGDDPVAGDYPYLAAEVGLHGDDVFEVAALIRAKHVAWTPVNAAIERLYFVAKAQIENPDTDIEDVPGVLDTAGDAMRAELAVLG